MNEVPRREEKDRNQEIEPVKEGEVLCFVFLFFYFTILFYFRNPQRPPSSP